MDIVTEFCLEGKHDQTLVLRRHFGQVGALLGGSVSIGSKSIKYSLRVRKLLVDFELDLGCTELVCAEVEGN